jgi:hypothetical protein
MMTSWNRILKRNIKKIITLQCKIGEEENKRKTEEDLQKIFLIEDIVKKEISKSKGEDFKPTSASATK